MLYRKVGEDNKECKIPKKDLFEANLPAGDYSAMIPKGTLEGNQTIK